MLIELKHTVPITYCSATGHVHCCALSDALKNLVRIILLGLEKSYKLGNSFQCDRLILFAVTLALVVTTITKLQRVFRSLAKGCQKHICRLILIGYSACSTDVKLSGSD